MPLPRFVARLNKRYTNRFIEPIVKRTRGFAYVDHVGRKSGAAYRTPIYAFPADDGSLVVSLTYGPSADWAQNVLAGGGSIVCDGRSEPIRDVQLIDRRAAWPHLPLIVRVWLRILRVQDFMLLTVV